MLDSQLELVLSINSPNASMWPKESRDARFDYVSLRSWKECLKHTPHPGCQLERSSRVRIACSSGVQTPWKICPDRQSVDTIGPPNITQILPQEFSSVTEANWFRQLILWEYFGLKDDVIFPKKNKTGWCNFSWITLIESPESIWCNWWCNAYTHWLCKNRMWKWNSRSSTGKCLGEASVNGRFGLAQGYQPFGRSCYVLLTGVTVAIGPANSNPQQVQALCFSLR